MECRCDRINKYPHIRTIEPTQDQKYIHMMFEKTFIKNVTNSYSCKQFIKKACKWRHNYTTKGDPKTKKILIIKNNWNMDTPNYLQ
jgi:hypothetical protein